MRGMEYEEGTLRTIRRRRECASPVSLPSHRDRAEMSWRTAAMAQIIVSSGGTFGASLLNGHLGFVGVRRHACGVRVRDRVLNLGFCILGVFG